MLKQEKTIWISYTNLLSWLFTDYLPYIGWFVKKQLVGDSHFIMLYLVIICVNYLDISLKNKYRIKIFSMLKIKTALYIFI